MNRRRPLDLGAGRTTRPSSGPRRTKIVATLGPATDSSQALEQLLRAGADVVRINFSHGSAQQRQEWVETIRGISTKLERSVGIMGDLQGPKIRIESFRERSTVLHPGQEFVLDTELDRSAGDGSRVGVAYKRLTDDVDSGDILLLDDGMIALEVLRVEGSRIVCSVTRGGTLSNNKGLNKQGGGISAPALTNKDREDIQQAAALQLDFVSVSFARNASDIEEARSLLRGAGGTGYLVAKIERAEAVTNILEIIDASDVIMVARGDLAVEVGYAAMTGLQKGIIRLARSRNKVSITATQMLESMINSASPTRAEVSDVANAVIDGTDAVMLSAETAIGGFPVQAVETMSKVCVGAEKHEQLSRAANYRIDDKFEHIDEAIAMASMYTANHLAVKAIVALTESGSTPLWMSRVRTDIPIFAFTRHETTRRRVTLYRGVYPVPFDAISARGSKMYEVIYRRLLADGIVHEGERILLTKGERAGISGGTNTMQILTIPPSESAIACGGD